MTYSLERVSNIFGIFWVIYEDDGVFEREVFHSRDIAEARKVLRELRNE